MGRARLQTVYPSKLAEVRAGRGVTQVELARAVGISERTLARLEHHRLRNPPLTWYVNISIALEVDLVELFDHWEPRWHYLSPEAPLAPPNGWWRRR